MDVFVQQEFTALARLAENYRVANHVRVLFLIKELLDARTGAGHIPSM